MNLELRLKEIKARLEEIRGLADTESDVEKLDALDKESDDLIKERKAIEKKIAMRGKFDVADIIETKNNEPTEELESRGKANRKVRRSGRTCKLLRAKRRKYQANFVPRAV